MGFIRRSCSKECFISNSGIVPGMLLLLLLLSRFSRVRLCATPETAAHQAAPSLGFSRQEHWSGLPFPSPMRESEKWKWSRSVVSDSCDPMDSSLPGSSAQGIFQARGLEWSAIANLSPIYRRAREHFIVFYSQSLKISMYNNNTKYPGTEEIQRQNLINNFLKENFKAK